MVALALLFGFTFLALFAWSCWEHDRQRAAWDEERHRLINRILARNTGEVVTLDQLDDPKPPRERDPDDDIIIEGF